MRRALTALLVAPCLACTGMAAPAEPTIGGVSGVAADGQSIIVSGRGFGSKSPVAPLKFDHFNDGSAGGLLRDHDPEWKPYDGVRGLAYSETAPHSGALALGQRNTEGEHFDTNFFTFAPAADELFVSYWWKIAVVNPGKTVIKMTRLNSSKAAGGGGVYSGTGNTTLGGSYNLAVNGGPYCAYNNGAVNETLIGRFSPPSTNTWVKVDMYKKLSTPGVADGIVSCRLHAAELVAGAAMTRAKGQSFLLDTVILGTMEGAAAPHDYWVYVDDVYIDNTRARVELCDAPRWADRTHGEMQLPHSTWTEDQLQITVNQGAFATGSTQYLYVVNQDGVANAEGFPIVLGPTAESAASPAVGEGAASFPPSNVVHGKSQGK